MAAQIRVGAAAKTDPILARSSLIASNILLTVARKPARLRRGTLVSEVNKIQPRLASVASAEYDRLLAAGVSDSQAMFDAIRLAVANHLAEQTAQLLVASRARTDTEALSGLGADFMQDLQKGFCVMGAGGSNLVAGYAETFTGGILKGGALTAGSAAAANVAGCNRDQIAMESQIAGQRANEALRLAEIQARSRSEMVRTVAIGGGVALLAIVGLVVVLK
jgi:hypothetical protein